MKKLDKTNFFIKIFIILIIAGSIYICINFYIKYTDNNQNKIANEVEKNDVNDDIANNQDNQNSDENGVDISVNLHDLLELEVSKKNCKPLFTDTDGIKYFSGTNECVDMNYVWYSGKLWRITAIYPDGALKMVTDNNITSIAFNMGEYTNFYTDENMKSYIYQWLNEDFYSTLYNAQIIIDKTKTWNTAINVNVGLLNSSEYYNSYRCIESETCVGSNYNKGYLNIGYYWWLLNGYGESYIWSVDSNGKAGHSKSSSTLGVRPSIIIKSGIKCTGNGTKNSPYRILDDMDTGKVNQYINTRLSGEYIKLSSNINNQIFRIIGIEDNKTKIIAMDYVDNGALKEFAPSMGPGIYIWGKDIAASINTWYTYLNNIYYPDLVSKYGELFDNGTYYFGISGYNYKSSVCENATNSTIKTCDKVKETGIFKIGLPRYGEIFATQQRGGESNSISMWLINGYTASEIWLINGNGNPGTSRPAHTHAARETLHLKKEVKIKSGSGTLDNPYLVGL